MKLNYIPFLATFLASGLLSDASGVESRRRENSKIALKLLW